MNFCTFLIMCYYRTNILRHKVSMFELGSPKIFFLELSLEGDGENGQRIPNFYFRTITTMFV